MTWLMIEITTVRKRPAMIRWFRPKIESQRMFHSYW